MNEQCDFREIARRACIWNEEAAARFVRSRFPHINGGKLRGRLEDFQTARNDLIHCRKCADPLSCPLSGNPMRLGCIEEGGTKIIVAKRCICRRWKKAREEKRFHVQEPRKDID